MFKLNVGKSWSTPVSDNQKEINLKKLIIYLVLMSCVVELRKHRYVLVALTVIVLKSY